MAASAIAEKGQFASYYREGLQLLKGRGEKNAFFIGIPDFSLIIMLPETHGFTPEEL